MFLSARLGERGLDAVAALERGAWERFGRGMVTGQVLTTRTELIC